MQTPLQLTWHGLDPSDAVEARIRRDVARLEHVFPRITGCTVALEAPNRHHRSSGSKYRVRIEVTVPGGRLVVGRDPSKTWRRGELHGAVNSAFREARRQLEDHVRLTGWRVKSHAPATEAVVTRMFPDDGYGFLLTPDGRDVYFHRHAVLAPGFALLRVGTRVRFVERRGDEGPQASTVRPVHRRAAARGGTP